MGQIVETSVELDDEENHRFVEELRKEANKEVYEMAITWQEALTESKAAGQAEGWAAGQARGRAESAHQAVLVAARGRFGDLPPAFENEIRSITDLDRLFALLERIARADRLDEVELS